MAPPNKRLKLPGARKLRKNCVASLAGLFVCGSTTLRQRALRPQLKRDPLGRYEHQVNFARDRRRASADGGPRRPTR